MSASKVKQLNSLRTLMSETTVYLQQNTTGLPRMWSYCQWISSFIAMAQRVS